MSPKPIRKLEKAAALEILLVLRGKDQFAKMELLHELEAGQTSMYSALEVLREIDLIEKKEAAGYPMERPVGLTAKGRKVAEKLREIEVLLSQGT